MAVPFRTVYEVVTGEPLGALPLEVGGLDIYLEISTIKAEPHSALAIL